jgi:hypothetical protein
MFKKLLNYRALQCPLCELTKIWNGKQRNLMLCILWLFHVVDIAVPNKSEFLPDISNRNRR